MGLASNVPGNVIPGANYTVNMMAYFVPENSIPGQIVATPQYASMAAYYGVPANVVPAPQNAIPASFVSAPAQTGAIHTVSLTSNRNEENSVHIINPTQTTLRFLLNNQSCTLASGETKTISGDNASVIEFDRGASQGPSLYTLTAGAYQFRGTQRGWELNPVTQTTELPRSVASL